MALDDGTVGRGGDPAGPDETLVEPPAAEGGPDALRAALLAAEREAAQAQERHLRALADFDNFRKRTAREREDWRRQAQADALREVLPVLDNFDRALAVPAPAGTDPGFRTGVELIHRDFLAVLERLGVRPFGSVGAPFDPQRHEAVSRVERADVADHTVVAEALRGYLHGERVLRPAQVVVAVHPPRPAGAGEDSA
jgi:molecular chaperone GrpE